MGNPCVRPIGALAALTAFLALSSVATAQQPGLPGQERPLTTHPDRPEAVKVWVTGNFSLDYVHRPAQLTVFTDSFSNPSGLGSATSDDENTFEGEVGIRFTAEMLNKVTVVIEVGTRRSDGDPVGAAGGINRFGDLEAIRPRLREGHIRFTDIFGPEISIEGGISTWKFNVRGKGGGFAFDPRRSQTVTRNLDSDGLINTRDDVILRFAEAVGTDGSMPLGATITYSGGALTIDVVALPTVTDEGGGAADDDQLYAIDALLGLDALGSRLGFIFAVTSTRTGSVTLAPGNAVIYTFGGGTSIMIMKGLEIYGEGYIQAGKAGILNLGGGRVAAAGRAAQIGAEWHYVVANPLPFWFGANFTHITGCDSDDPNNRRASRFAAYEGTADLMIIEDPYYGFDWDSNIQALKVSGGLSLDIASDKPDLDLVLILGFTKATAAVNTPGGPAHGLGNEVDFKATWHMTKQFALKASFAYLWNSALLQQAMAGLGNPNAADHAWLFVLGWDLVF